jgi:NAD(P)-dependent dehydrogenase (short-subunit alcohol dehydrogenase family)
MMSSADDLLQLDGRVALITGAARGIGAATALLFRRFGADLALCDRLAPDEYPPIDAVGSSASTDRAGDVLVMQLDVRDPEATDAFVDEVIDRFGRIDVLVNNAGGTFASPFTDVSPKGESMLVAENFTQVTHLIRRAVPVMPAGGSIINITSIEAHQAAPGFAIYAAMKAAVASLTKSLALELAPRGIRVNAIAPDALPSPGEQGARDQLLADPVGFDPTFLPPWGRFGGPDDAARSALFLAGGMAGFITGVTLHVDGGNHAAGGWRLDQRPAHETR